MNNKIIFIIGVLALVAICLATAALVVSFKAPAVNTLGSVDLNAYNRTAPTSGQWSVADNLLTGELYALSSTTVLGDFAIGSQGTKIDSANFGVCHLFTGAEGALTTFSASTTIALDCQATSPKLGDAPAALTGVVANDTVLVQPSTTTPVTGARTSFVVLGVSASTTAGFISVVLANESGADFTLASSSIRNWRYWVVR